MATEFVMPKLGLTMEEGTIAEWLVPDGAEVTAGAPVLRVETDKTETDIEASADGVMHHAAGVGETFPCGAVVGWFLAPGEAPPAVTATPVGGGSVAAPANGDTSAAPAPVTNLPPTGAGVTGAGLTASGRLFVSPNARRMAAERGVPLNAVRGTGPNGRIVSEDIEAFTPGAAAPLAPAPSPTAVAGARAVAPGHSAALATFAGRQLADLLGIDLGTVAPDPTSGRVTRDGVAAHVRSLLAQPAAGAASTPKPSELPAALQKPTEVIPLKGMRGTIARRMHQSLTEMAQLTLFMDADLDAVVADRATRAESGKPPSYTDYVIAAAARALQDHPYVNAQITEDGVALLPAIHVGMAVAVDNGLIVPVLSNTLAHSLSSLATESARLAEACREGSVALTDLEGGTFSVSTLGMFGVDGFTPVINPPNAAILGVGRLRDELVLADDGAVTSRKRMTLSLTWDHRAFDGAPAAAFTQSIVSLLSNPKALDS